MNVKILKKLDELAHRLDHFFIATANKTGLPHVGVAGKCTVDLEGHIIISAWFCPGTMINLQINSKVALVLWDATVDIGYQVLGEVETIEDMAIMNGYSPERDKIPPLPQIERKLFIKVKEIIGFSQAPHSELVIK